MKKLKVLISAILLSYLAWRTDWAQVADAFARLKPAPWLAAAALYALAQLVSAWRWKLLAEPLGFDRPLRHFAGFYFIGMFFNLVLPTSVGGDVVRTWYLDDRSGRRRDALLSVLVDRGSGLLVLLALACLGSLCCPIALPTWVHRSVWATAGFAGLAGAAVLLVYRFRGRAEIKVLSLYFRRPGLVFATTLLSLVVQATNVVILWLVGLAIDAPVPATYYWIAVPMVTLLTVLPISLNGMGLREGGLILFLQPLGVTAGTALSLAFLWFLVFTSVSLLGGCVYLFGRFPRPEVQTDHGPIGHHSDQGRRGKHRAAA